MRLRTVVFTALILTFTRIAGAQAIAGYQSVVDTNTRFALKLVRARAGAIRGNEALSPIALSAGFAALRNGASANCAKDIAATFDFGPRPQDSLNREYHALIKQMFSFPSPMPGQRSAGEKLPPPPGLYFANAAWIMGGGLQPAFLQVNKDFYQAEAMRVAPDAAVAAINAWAEKKSFGTISEVVNAGDLQYVNFMFTSLLYFRSLWSSPFDPKKTHDAEFTLLSGQKKYVQMMARKTFLDRYLQTPGFEAIELEYENGQVMYIFLPARNSSLRGFEESLTPENWKAWTASFERREGVIELPRFRFLAETYLQGVLSDLGSGCAFHDRDAFGGAVLGGAGTLTKVKQKVLLASDEKGTEAVMFTGMGMAGASLPKPAPPFHMVVDRPFFIALVDAHSTGALFLVASVVEP